MATVNVTKTRLDLNEPKELVFTSATSADTITLDYNGAGDEKLVAIFKGAATIKYKKGSAIQGVVDVEQAITAEGAVRIDSGLFKQVTGTNKGKVEVTATSAVNVALIQLP